MLGSRKFLIFGLVSSLVLSLLIVGSFAAEPEDVKALGGGGALKVPPPADIGVSRKLFVTQYQMVSTSLGGATGWAFYNDGHATQSHPMMLHYFYWNGVLREFEDDVVCYILPISAFSDSSYSWSVNGEVITFNVRADKQVAMCVASFSPITDNFGAYVVKTTVPALFGFFYSLVATIFGIGDSLVAFVIARPIVLIPIVAMILVLSYGVIRRLIKGV